MKYDVTRCKIYFNNHEWISSKWMTGSVHWNVFSSLRRNNFNRSIDGKGWNTTAGHATIWFILEFWNTILPSHHLFKTLMVHSSWSINVDSIEFIDTHGLHWILAESSIRDVFHFISLTFGIENNIKCRYFYSFDLVTCTGLLSRWNFLTAKNSVMT